MTWIDDSYEAACGANLVVILTEWALFREMDLATQMAQPRIADLRNIHSPDALRAEGLTAVSALVPRVRPRSLSANSPKIRRIRPGLAAGTQR